MEEMKEKESLYSAVNRVFIDELWIIVIYDLKKVSIN